MTQALNIIFAGTPAFALPSLMALYQSHHCIKAVYTQPDRRAGRGLKLQSSPVKQWALEHDIAVYQPVDFKQSQTCLELAKQNPDILVVIAYGLLLPKNVLTIPRLGCINVHASLLPRWRGASPIQHALLAGDDKTGVTIMQMDVGLDTGDMLAVQECSIQSTDTAVELHEKLAHLAIAPLLHTLDALATGVITRKSQDNSHATYAPKINKEAAKIDWQKSAQEIDQQIRAYNPWPIAYTHIQDSVLKIHKASILAETSTHAPGTILAIEKTGIKVATRTNTLSIEIIQFPGAKALHVANWLNAHSTYLQPGFVLT